MDSTESEARIFDDASHHYGGNWPPGLPRSQAYVHTGLFLGWIVGAGLCSERFSTDHAADLKTFRSGGISGPALFERIGGILSSDMLSDEGAAFASEYFDLEQGAYLDDYGHLLADRQPTAYHVPDTAESARRISERIDLRYAQWKQDRTQ